MGAWLVGQQYLRVNPFAGLPAAPAVALDTTGRTLTRAQWQYVLHTANGEIPATWIPLLRHHSVGTRRAKQRCQFEVCVARGSRRPS